MTREPYIKPQVKSEVLEPEALCGAGSNAAGGPPPNDFVPNGYDACLTTIRKWLT